MVSTLVLIYFGWPWLGHTIKTNFKTFQAANLEICSILTFLWKGLGLLSSPHFVYDFSRKCFSCCILLIDQMSLSGCFTSWDILQYVYCKSLLNWAPSRYAPYPLLIRTLRASRIRALSIINMRFTHLTRLSTFTTINKGLTRLCIPSLQILLRLSAAMQKSLI